MRKPKVREGQDWDSYWSSFGFIPNPQWAWLKSIPLSFPIWRILKLKILAFQDSENPEAQFAECPASPRFRVTLSRWIKAVQLFWSMVQSHLRLVLVLSNSQVLRAPFYPMRQWFQRKNTQQYVAVAQHKELVNRRWASVLLLPLFLIPCSRYVLNASFQPMPFDG